MATAVKRLTESFPWPAEAGVLTGLRAFTLAIEARLGGLESVTQDYTATVEYLRGILIDRINEVLGPAYDAINEQLTGGFSMQRINDAGTRGKAVLATESTADLEQLLGLNRTDNPHQVTAEQTGAYTKATSNARMVAIAIALG
jgi:hypothetical protein